MRHSTLTLALAIALAGASSTALAQTDPAAAAQIAELKAQLAEMQAKIAALEERTDAQSDINVSTQENLDKLAASTPTVETKGGLKVTSADKKFEVSLGGRLHFDTYLFDHDRVNSTSGTEFRRARLTLAGKAFGWDYKVEQDFAAGSSGTLQGFRDVYIARSAFGGKVTIGQFKPYRSMEELTSSNEILMPERPYASATGLFTSRQFQQGVGYLRAGDNYTAGLSVFNLRDAAATRNEGVGVAGRVTFAPINDENSTLHFGGWASNENINEGGSSLSAVANYAGRRGPSQSIATTPNGEQVTAYGLEAAGAFGPLFFQGEYVNATFSQLGGGDQDVATWYLQGSWMLNGGHKVYKAANGIFGSPKVGDKGLWELTARYDTIENKDIANLEASSWILGLNYYVNPNLRFMLNYTQGDNQFTGDETAQYSLRTQFNW